MSIKLRRSDRGASAVLIAATMFLLMGFAAVAIDTGRAFDDRRQEQSAADAGVLAALQFAKTTLPTTICSAYSGANRAVCRGAEEAMAVVNANFPDLRYTAARWASCTDPSKPAAFTRSIAAVSRCISFTDNFQKARVVLPGTTVPTTFGRLLGRDSIAVGAFAEAGLDLGQSADVLPFAVGPTAANTNQACLFANTTSQLDVPPCNGPTSGNFGKLDMSIYGNSTLGTVEQCGGNAGAKMAINIVVGSDHPLETAATSPGTVNDRANCNAGPIITNPVDQLNVQTGNSFNPIEEGLYLSVAPPALEGRLRCKDGDASESPTAGKVSSNCVVLKTSYPESIDDTPLWNFINGSPSEVSPAGACNGVNTRQLMEACMAAWRAYGAHPVSSSLFTSNITTAARFAAVPILHVDPDIGASVDYDITGFKPVYLETAFLGCTANKCDVAHSPGEASTGACPSAILPTTNSCGFSYTGNKNFWALTSFMLNLDMLHPTIRENFPSVPGTIVFNLSR